MTLNFFTLDVVYRFIALNSTWRHFGAVILAVAATATMLTLALPLGEQSYLGWFVFVPVLRVVKGKGFLTAFALALSSIFLAAWISVSGLMYRVQDAQGSPAWVYTGFGIFGFSVCLAIGAWGDRATAKFPAWWFAGLAILFEAYLLVQLPAHLALSQYRSVLMLQIAALGGIWLVSFLLWWSNFALANLSWKQLIAAIAAIVPCSLLLAGVRLPTVGKSSWFGVIQIAEPDDEHLASQQRLISGSHPDFVVWPEFAGIPFVQFGDTTKLVALSREKGLAPIITSYPDDLRPLPHNTGALFQGGQISKLYYKRRLFGGESKMHTPGDQAVATTYADGRVGLNICFDSCYPEIIRDTARIPGVNIISLPSIDPYATNNFIAAMHASYTPFRAAENGVSFVKADGLAYSMFVDPFGQIVSELPPGDRTQVVSLPIETHWTPYRQFGDWFLWLTGFAVLIPLVNSIRAKMRDRRDQQINLPS